MARLLLKATKNKQIKYIIVEPADNTHTKIPSCELTN